MEGVGIAMRTGIIASLHLPLHGCLSAEWNDYSQLWLSGTSNSAADPLLPMEGGGIALSRGIIASLHLPSNVCLSAECTDYSQLWLSSTSNSAVDPLLSMEGGGIAIILNSFRYILSMSSQVQENLLDRILISIGAFVREKWTLTADFFTFMLTLLRNCGSAFELFHLTLEQAYVVGVTSIPLIITTSVFTGAVVAWQMAYQFADMIPLTFVGMAVGKSVMLELGPMLTSMVMAGRIGASMCSELGTMAVTEQIDAMRILGLNPFKFLLAPRLVATVLMMPVLTVISMTVAILGGFAVSHFGKDVTWQVFVFGIRMFFSNWDLLVGMIKSATFGFLIASFACFFGYTTTNGAEGVGRNTKATVVASMTAILITGFLISKFLLL